MDGINQTNQTNIKKEIDKQAQVKVEEKEAPERLINTLSLSLSLNLSLPTRSKITDVLVQSIG